MEYIDIHNHTLFGVDDGPNHIQESLDMLREADLQGIREIILTPHYRHGMFRYELDEIERNFAELLKQVEENQINVRLYLGCEYHVDSDIFEHIHVCTTRYYSKVRAVPQVLCVVMRDFYCGPAVAFFCRIWYTACSGSGFLPICGRSACEPCCCPLFSG